MSKQKEEAASSEAASVDSSAAPPDDGVLDKAAFKAQAKASDKTEVVEGCRVRVLTRRDFQEIKVLQAEHGFIKKSKAAFELAEDAAILSLGVVAPAMTFDEWLTVLNDADQVKIETIVTAIRDLSGMATMEQQLTKKALSEILDTSKSSMSV